MQSSNLKLKKYDEEYLSSEKLILQEIGSVLKDTREKKSLTLDEVKEITCIPIHHILAIESGSRESLPEEFYLIGFLKRYAKALGLNEKSITNMYSRKTAFINTEVKKDDTNADFDLLFDNGGDNSNLFKRERKKLNNMDKEKSFFNIFHFYLFIGAILFVSAIYLGFNLIVNNPFDSKNKTFKEIIVENEHEEEFADNNLSGDEASEDISTADDSKIANNDPNSDVVLEFKEGSASSEEEVDEDVFVSDEIPISNNKPEVKPETKAEIKPEIKPEAKIVVKSFSPSKTLTLNDIKKPVVKPVIKPVETVNKVKVVQAQPVVKSFPVKKTPVVQKVIAVKPAPQAVKKVIQARSLPVVKPVVKKVNNIKQQVAVKPVQVKPQQVKTATNQKFCTLKKPVVVKPQVIAKAPKASQKAIQNIQKPIIVESKKPVEIQKIAKASPAKSEIALKAPQAPVLKPAVQESPVTEEIMLRPLRIVE